MAGTKYNDFVNKLEDYEMLELHRELMEGMYNRSIVARPHTPDPIWGAMHDHGSLMTSTSENVPPSPTLQGSDRPSFQLSWYSGETASLKTHATNQSDSRSVFQSDYPEHDISSHVASPEKAPLDEEQSVTAYNTGAETQPASTEAPKSYYFCTFCAEIGTHKSFGTKYDWIRHEQNFHKTNCEWHCQFKGCFGVFERQQDVRKHIQKEHLNHGHVMPHSPYREIPLLEPRLFACGFKLCGKISTTWKDRCNHVSECMREKGAEWSYTRKIRALLRHQDISPTWKTVKAKWSQQLAFDAWALEWDPIKTRSIRQQLECLSFNEDIEQMLHKLFKLGHPRCKTFPGFQFPQVPPNGFPVITNNFPTTPLVLGHALRSYDAQRFHPQQQQPVFDQYGLSEAPINPPQNRRSVVMTDVPSFDVPSAESELEVSEHSDLLNVQEMLFSGYATNKTPPLPSQDSQDSIEFSSKSPKPSPARRLVRRSKGLLRKRSQDLSTPIDPALTSPQRQPSAPQNNFVPNAYAYGAGVTFGFPG